MTEMRRRTGLVNEDEINGVLGGAKTGTKCRQREEQRLKKDVGLLYSTDGGSSDQLQNSALTCV